MKSLKLARSFGMPYVNGDEDASRRTRILNILLLATIALLLIAIWSSIIVAFLTSPQTRVNNAMSIMSVFCILIFFVSLYSLSRSGHAQISSFIFTGTFFILSSYFAVRWGADVTIALLFYSLTILIAGVLLSSRAAITTAILLSSVIVSVTGLQLNHILALNSYWRETPLLMEDTVIIALILLIISLVSWISNREIEKSLTRALKSEFELKEERDLLEIRIHERTSELRKVELDRIAQAYKFVEFGRIAGSLFHDLTNPLTALSLNMERIANGAGKPKQFGDIANDIERACSAIDHMRQLMNSMRRHLAKEGRKEDFRLDLVVKEVVYTLNTYANAQSVHIVCKNLAEIQRYGDSVAFMQITMNLISNAIESFDEVRDEGTITIELQEEASTAVLTVRDTGRGMSDEMRDRIFEPFFTTKTNQGGLGIGLSLAKRMLEKEFNGTLSIVTALGSGTTFTVYFP